MKHIDFISGTEDLHDSQLYNAAEEYDQLMLQFTQNEVTDQDLVQFLENFEHDLTREERKFIF